MTDDEYTIRATHGLPIQGLVIDCHMHMGEESRFHIIDYGNIDLFVREMDRHGVDAGAVSSIPGAVGGLQTGQNDMVLEAVRRYPQRLFGWITANPHYPDAMREQLERAYEAGCRGVKIHSSVGLSYDHVTYRVMFDFAAERGLPILAHTWGKDLDALEPYLKQYKGLRWALAHAGCVELDKYVRIAATYENVYLDICLSRSPRGLIEHFVTQGLTEKVMFGSDCYFMGLAQQLGRVVFAKISPEQKAMILGRNARRFFGELCPV